MIRTLLTGAQWAAIAPHSLGRECDPGRTGPNPRLFSRQFCGLCGRDVLAVICHQQFGAGIQVFKRFCRWVKADVFYQMFRSLAEKCDFEYAVIDGITSEIMALTDALGNLIDVRLLPGQTHDRRGISALIDGLICGQLPADFDHDSYKGRHVIENFFGKLKE